MEIFLSLFTMAQRRKSTNFLLRIGWYHVVKSETFRMKSDLAFLTLPGTAAIAQFADWLGPLS